MEDLQDTARLLDQAQELDDTPRTRQLRQFVATAAQLHHEATELRKKMCALFCWLRIHWMRHRLTIGNCVVESCRCGALRIR